MAEKYHVTQCYWIYDAMKETINMHQTQMVRTKFWSENCKRKTHGRRTCRQGNNINTALPRQVMCVEARSWNHCCSGKAINITYSQFAYPACNARAPYCQLWLARLCHFFPHYLIDGTIFGQKFLEHKTRVCFFSTIFSETFLILRIIRRDINVHRSSCKLPVILVRL
jgi:hypothetical protein